MSKNAKRRSEERQSSFPVNQSFSFWTVALLALANTSATLAQSIHLEHELFSELKLEAEFGDLAGLERYLGRLKRESARRSIALAESATYDSQGNRQRIYALQRMIRLGDRALAGAPFEPSIFSSNKPTLAESGSQFN